MGAERQVQGLDFQGWETSSPGWLGVRSSESLSGRSEAIERVVSGVKLRGKGLLKDDGVEEMEIGGMREVDKGGDNRLQGKGSV
jgi:hypothetical protein